ncbi:DoxX family protein [Halopolyspora algeriensis]|uniref:DoxX family protein n=1 Tax=Halopolyspora algeriensis TaxID=1500506 RepID=UPI0014773D61|nr:DoxX family protein [Halopolyspora algeriensis]
MSSHDDRPRGEGDYPEDHDHSNAPAAEEGVHSTTQPVAAVASQDRAAGDHRDLDVATFDDEAYSDPEMAWGYDVDQYDEPFPGREPLRWNAGADLGLLILRVTLGGVFMAHGAQKLFGLLGGPGPGGFARMLQQMGFRRNETLALVTGATELGGGALLVLGLFTPLAAAGLVGVMVNALAVKYGSGFFASSGGVEYELVLAGLALGLLFTGPGRAALDNGRSWFRRPLVAGFLGLAVAAAASATVFLLFHGRP